MSQTTTFLLTDVESSTRLWEQDWAAMARAMQDHERTIDEVVASYGGSVLKHRGEGDSAFAVFEDAAAAVEAACALQLALSDSPLRVRAAVHSGAAVAVGGDYIGTEVNRCARLRGLAHGGQTLVSGATHALVAGGLPGDVTLTDLGVYVLRDLVAPEHVFQLCHARLRADFPPLRSPHPTVAHLLSLVEDVTDDVTRLPARSPALGVDGHIELADEAHRAAFLRDVQSVLGGLTEKYDATGSGEPYRIAFACYPEVKR